MKTAEGSGLGGCGDSADAEQSAPPSNGAAPVLIVIPCLNEAAVLADVVARILADDRLEAPVLVIADGGSTDGTVQIAQGLATADPRVRLLTNPKRLQSAGINLAARSAGAGATWMVRVDAHADYPQNYVSSLIDEAHRTGATSVVVSMETRGKAGFQRAAAAAQNSVLGAGGSAHRSRGRKGWVDHGHHALFRLADFLAAGGYDEGFSHNEDAELDLRLVQRGSRIWLTDKVRIVYYPRASGLALGRQYFNYGKGRARTVLKHRMRLKVRQALPLAVAPAVLLALAAPLFWPLAIPALAWLGAVLVFGLLSGLAKGDAAVMASGWPAGIMHLAWSAGFWTELVGRRAPARPGLRAVPAAS
ncbi:MAG TPA: glycosyltransferase family 2 protein [Phenylobacterium sp.]|nr:glycosyltransferase family 2 protein [Phenylobacterium sp.]